LMCSLLFTRRPPCLNHTLGIVESSSTVEIPEQADNHCRRWCYILYIYTRAFVKKGLFVLPAALFPYMPNQIKDFHRILALIVFSRTGHIFCQVTY
jgi:hypothetical protein